ncbi:MAG: hypothetical protein KJO19_10125 [Woeseia sp.]|nr:hypothetical protein [Woeseia sp.]
MLHALVMVLALSAQVTMPEPVQAEIAWVAEGGFCEPETVLPLPDDTLLVSNVCDFRTDGNGFLTLLDKDGSAIDWRVVQGLDAPLGMALVGERLYVVDNNRVKIFAWPDYRLLETIAVETAVANDIAVAADGRFWVTDTARGQVIEHTSQGVLSVFLEDVGFKGANGIALNGQRLFVGGERLWCVDLESGAVTTVGPEWLRDIDGIEFEANNTLQVTPVGGPLVRIRTDGGIDVLGGEGVSSANHGYAPRLGLALIPTGFDNTVIAVRLPLEADASSP